MKKIKGFTLLELLVVIAIIGLLSTLAVVALGNARMKARDTKRIFDLKQISTALELYYDDNNRYPKPGGMNSTDPSSFIAYRGQTQNLLARIALYLGQIPDDPLSSNAVNPDDWIWYGDEVYGWYYQVDSDLQSYDLITRLENLNHPEACAQKGQLFQADSSNNSDWLGSGNAEPGVDTICNTAACNFAFTEWGGGSGQGNMGCGSFYSPPH